MRCQPPSNLYEGVVVKKSWSKSTESYCAQGSDYFTLEGNAQRWVLSLLSPDAPDQLAMWEGKRVRIAGEVQVKTISPNPEGACPVSVAPDGGIVDFTCEVLLVKKVWLK
jgi:hypothetical protein